MLAETGDAPEAHETTGQGLAIAKELSSRDDATADEFFNYAESFLICEPADLRQPLLALDYARKALAKSAGHRGAYLDLLARAYSQSGNAKEAVNTEEKALSSSQEEQDQKTYKRHLAQFKAAER